MPNLVDFELIKKKINLHVLYNQVSPLKGLPVGRDWKWASSIHLEEETAMFEEDLWEGHKAAHSGAALDAESGSLAGS